MAEILEIHGARELVSHSPATGEELGRVPVASSADIHAAFEKAQTAQTTWAEIPVAKRVHIFERLKDLILNEQDEIIELISRENGKSHGEALAGEILSSLDTISYFCDRAESDLADENVNMRILKTQKSMLVKTPYGVVAVISPWNYPFYLGVCVLIPALLAGNGVLYKPSEFTPLIGQKLHDLIVRAGVPADVFQILQGDGRVGAQILDEPIRKVCFTGSGPTGRKIMQKAAEKPIPVCLELGGKDAFIVLEDADLERAARGAVWGGFANCGQICASVERIFVSDKVYDDFVDKLVKHTQSLQVGGDPADYDVGPLIHQRQLKIVEDQVNDAVNHGARALTGGQRIQQPGGNWFAPTVLVDVDESMKVMKDETFGPVLPVVKVHSEEEAIRRANDCKYGLTASVWTKDEKRAIRIARRLDVGHVTINDHLTGTEPPELPWGGVKESGVGHTRGASGIKDFVVEKHIGIDRMALSSGNPLWFPFDKSKQSVVKRAIHLFASSPALKLKGLFKS